MDYIIEEKNGQALLQAVVLLDLFIDLNYMRRVYQITGSLQKHRHSCV